MFAAEQGWRATGFSYLEAFIEPFGTLWFIYLLPIFFVVIKLTRGLPWPAIWLVGAALEAFSRVERLDANNAWRCGHCKQATRARKQITIFQQPNVLMVQLKRFRAGTFGKVNKPVHFPLRLSLRQRSLNLAMQAIHRQRRGDPVAGDVHQHDRQRAIFAACDIDKIAADLAHRLVSKIKLHRTIDDLRRKQFLVDSPGVRKLALHFGVS